MSDLAFIVPVYNRVEYTINFIECLKKNTRKAWTLFIIDDGSTDGTDRMLAVSVLGSIQTYKCL